MDKPITDYEIIELMGRIGGSFIKQLAKLWSIGDLDNQRRLKRAFPHYWKEYEGMILLERRRKERDAAAGSV